MVLRHFEAGMSILTILGEVLLGGQPELDWIQVEVSTHCNASCTYCPHTAYRRKWESRHLPLKVFEKLVLPFESTGHVHLQGWGEPFTHPHLIDMLRIAKRAGCAVGTTTNGTLVDHEMAELLVEEGLDMVAFSLAGVDERNDAVRRGTRLRDVLIAIEHLQRAKANRNSEKPAVHLAYLLLRSGLADLAGLPSLLTDAGVDQAVVSSLSLVVRPELVSETFLDLTREQYEGARAQMIETRQVAGSAGVDVHFRVASPFAESRSCSENVGRALVVAADGSVTPCVMANLPAIGENARVAFGSVAETTLGGIWRRADYQQFRRAFAEGGAPARCAKCPNLSIDDLADGPG